MGKRIDGNRCLWRSASYTVEAAYLAPMILFLMMLVWTAGLYLHDRCTASFDAEAITIRGRMLSVGNSEEKETEFAAFISEEGTKALMMTSEAAADGTISGVKITSSVDGSINNVFTALFRSWGWPLFEGFCASDEDWLVNPCTLIRGVRILDDQIGED